MRSALAFGLATAAVLVTADPGGAQSGEEPPLNPLAATLAPEHADEGDEVTVTSTDDCAVNDTGVVDLVWAVFPAGFDWEDGASWDRDSAVLSGRAEPFGGGESDGDWSLTFAAPAPDDGGLVDQMDAPPGEPLDVYGPLPFHVGNADFDFVAKCMYSVLGQSGMTITPDPVEAGETAVITPPGPCPMPATRGGDVAWALEGPAGSNQHIVDSGLIPLPADGTWSLEIEAPPEPGLYGVFGSTGAISGIECLSPEGGRTSFFNFVLFNVTESDEPPTTATSSTTTTRPTTSTTVPPTTPRPPVPILDPPPYTG